MDPITIIVTAFVLGAAAGLKTTVEPAVKDAYAGLKTLIQRKYDEVELSQLERKPDSNALQQTVNEELHKAGANSDNELLEAARQLMELIPPETAQSLNVDLGKYDVATDIELASERDDVIGANITVGDIGQNVTIGRNVFRFETTRPKQTLRQVIERLSIDDNERRSLIEELNEYESIAQTTATSELKRQAEQYNLELEKRKIEAKQAEDTFNFELEKKKKELGLDLQQKQNDLLQKERELNRGWWLRLLDKEIIAVIIGGILLIMMGTALTWSIFNQKEMPQFAANVFFIILGYFFGQVAIPGGLSSEGAGKGKDGQS